MRNDAARLGAAELLALCLGTGVVGRDVFHLARDVLEEYGSLEAVLQASPQRLCQTHGLGAAKVARLKAVAEITTRLAEESFMRDPAAFSDAARVTQYLQRRNRTSRARNIRLYVSGCAPPPDYLRGDVFTARSAMRTCTRARSSKGAWS